MPPVIGGLHPSQGNTSGGNPVVITGSGFTGTFLVRFRSAQASFIVVSDTQINATAPANAAGPALVGITSSVGASNTVTYTYVSAPVIAALNPSQGPTSGENPVVITGAGFAGVTSARFGAASVPFTAVNATQINAVAAAGTDPVAVTVTASGGTSDGVTYTYATVPVIGALSVGQGPAGGGNPVTVTGSGLAGATSVRFGAASAPFVVVSGTRIDAVAPAGTGPVAVTVVSAVGTSNPVTYTYVPVPVIGALSVGQGPAGGGNPVTVTGSGLAGVTSVRFGAASASFVVVSGTRIDAVAPAGTGSVAVTVTTPGGTSNSAPYSYLAVPTVTGLGALMGPEAGGNTVTITGTSLSLTDTVMFGPHAATNVSVISDSRITVTAPGGAGTVTVVVTTPGGTSEPDLGGAYYTYLGIPVVDSLTPDEGPASGGTAVAIAGSDLTYTDEVRFGGTPAFFAAVSDNLVVATAPAGVPGTVTVTVHTPGGNSDGSTYQRRP